MSVDQRSLDEVVLAYIEAWSTPDAALRREDSSAWSGGPVSLARARFGPGACSRRRCET